MQNRLETKPGKLSCEHSSWQPIFLTQLHPGSLYKDQSSDQLNYIFLVWPIAWMNMLLIVIYVAIATIAFYSRVNAMQEKITLLLTMST